MQFKASVQKETECIPKHVHNKVQYRFIDLFSILFDSNDHRLELRIWLNQCTGSAVIIDSLYAVHPNRSEQAICLTLHY